MDGRLWPRCLIVVYCPLKMASLLSSHSAAWMFRWETWVGGHSHTQPAPRAQLHPRQESSPSSNALYSGTCAHQSPLCLPQWPTLESCLSYLQHALDAEPPLPRVIVIHAERLSGLRKDFIFLVSVPLLSPHQECVYTVVPSRVTPTSSMTSLFELLLLLPLRLD